MIHKINFFVRHITGNDASDDVPYETVNFMNDAFGNVFCKALFSSEQNRNLLLMGLA